MFTKILISLIVSLVFIINPTSVSALCGGNSGSCYQYETQVCTPDGCTEGDPGCSCTTECTGPNWTCNACSDALTQENCNLDYACAGHTCSCTPSGYSCTWTSSTEPTLDPGEPTGTTAPQACPYNCLSPCPGNEHPEYYCASGVCCQTGNSCSSIGGDCMKGNPSECSNTPVDGKYQHVEPFSNYDDNCEEIACQQNDTCCTNSYNCDNTCCGPLWPTTPTPTPIPPNLLIQNMSLNPASPLLVNQAHAVNITVKNDSLGAAGSFIVVLFRDCADLTNLATCVQRGTSSLSSLAANSSSTVSVDISGVNLVGTVGSHTYYAMADFSHQVAETNENDNVNNITFLVSTPVTPTPTCAAPPAPVFNGYTFSGNSEIVPNRCWALPAVCVSDATPVWNWTNTDPGGYCSITGTKVYTNDRYNASWSGITPAPPRTSYEANMAENSCLMVSAKYLNPIESLSFPSGQSLGPNYWVQRDTLQPNSTVSDYSCRDNPGTTNWTITRNADSGCSISNHYRVDCSWKTNSFSSPGGDFDSDKDASVSSWAWSAASCGDPSSPGTYSVTFYERDTLGNWSSGVTDTFNYPCPTTPTPTLTLTPVPPTITPIPPADCPTIDNSSVGLTGSQCYIYFNWTDMPSEEYYRIRRNNPVYTTLLQKDAFEFQNDGLVPGSIYTYNINPYYDGVEKLCQDNTFTCPSLPTNTPVSTATPTVTNTPIPTAIPTVVPVCPVFSRSECITTDGISTAYFTWTDLTSEEGYKVKRDTIFQTNLGIGSVAYSQSSLTPGSSYSYEINPIYGGVEHICSERIVTCPAVPTGTPVVTPTPAPSNGTYMLGRVWYDIDEDFRRSDDEPLLTEDISGHFADIDFTFSCAGQSGSANNLEYNVCDFSPGRGYYNSPWLARDSINGPCSVTATINTPGWYFTSLNGWRVWGDTMCPNPPYPCSCVFEGWSGSGNIIPGECLSPGGEPCTKLKATVSDWLDYIKNYSGYVNMWFAVNGTITPTATPTPTCIPVAPGRADSPYPPSLSTISTTSVNLGWALNGFGNACPQPNVNSVSWYLVSQDNSPDGDLTDNTTVCSEVSQPEDTQSGTCSNLEDGKWYYWQVVTKNGDGSDQRTLSEVFSFRVVVSQKWWQADSGNVVALTNIGLNWLPDDEYLIKGTLGSPGIVRYGESISDLITGKLSTPSNWKYNSAYRGEQQTYDYLINKLQVNETDNYPAGTIPSESGVYYSSTGKTISGALGADDKVQIYVNGDVVIDNNIDVPVGSFLAIVASGNITFSANVTQAEGFFLADGVLGVESNGTGDDVVFVGQGSFVGQGGVSLNRDLRDNNLILPAESFIVRPDFYVNVPYHFTYQDRIFTELRP